MRSLRPLSFAFPALALLLCCPDSAQADRIIKVDGSAVDDVTILKETLTEVEYKSSTGRTTKKVPAHEIRRVVFEKLPPQIDAANAAIAGELYLDAINDLQEFLKRFDEKPPRSFPWSVHYARYRLLQLYDIMGEYAEVVGAADTLIEKSPTSRYATLAHIAKIESLARMNEPEALTGAVSAFEAFVKDNSLPSRWRLEAELRGVLFDTKLTGEPRRKRLGEVIAAAGKEAPIVKSRATVAIGESYYSDRMLAEAEETFAKVIGDPGADAQTLAAAHTGIGDCIYSRGMKLKKDMDDSASAVLQEAALHYLRVVVLYSDQLQYVPRSMFFAGRCFDEQDTEESDRRAQALYNKLIRSFPGTKSAKEARSYRKRR